MRFTQIGGIKLKQLHGKKLPVLVALVTNHDASDDCGVEILGQEVDEFWKDHKGAQVNAIRTRTS